MSSTQLFPEVLDASTVEVQYSTPTYLPIGIEGQAGSDGDASVGELVTVRNGGEALTAFGATSPLTNFIRFLLLRQADPIFAVASVKGTDAPELEERQAAWSVLESERDVRLRLCDSVTQADLAALTESCWNANMMGHKQVAFGGLAAATSKASLISAADAIGDNRLCLVGPGVYDSSGSVVSGAYAAAGVAAMICSHNDLSDDLDLATLPFFTAIENNNVGRPLFSQRVASGLLVNDFEDLLQAGVSPLMNARTGGVAITHLTTTDTSQNGAWDSVMTRIAVDQVFVNIRGYAETQLALRQPNTASNRGAMASGIRNLLVGMAPVVQPTEQADRTIDYGVSVTASSDQRQMIIGFKVQVARGTSTILVSGTFEIPV